MAETPHEGSIEMGEPGRGADGETIFLDRRLFVQFLAFGNCGEISPLARTLEEEGLPATLYEDVNDPRGVGLVTFSEDPDFFVHTLRPVLNRTPFAHLELRPEYTMLGRTYSRGYEQDLEETLIERPKRRILDPELRWGVWYPLRRSGAFEMLDEKEQRAILAEHGAIGHGYGRAGLAHDVRLDCRGLNKDDNDFVIGVLGHELYPLSRVVQRMRKTRQTSQYLTHLGPFFTGRVAWQAKVPVDGR
ncbi:MAG TPA: chlorite dismutase family protein [Spirochaetia bacterium]|nr:chlorite dismutase family protein [Spirochaetia bacterium]